jgi:hypothetical protein
MQRACKPGGRLHGQPPPPRLALRSIAVSLLLVCATLAAHAERTVTLPQFRADVNSMQSLVAACSANATSCEPTHVSADEDVGKPGVDGGFVMHWNWLRSALEQAAKATATVRSTGMHEASDRLQQLAQDSAGSQAATADASFAKERALANSILARPEFGAAQGPSFWDRLLARLWKLVDRLIEGVSALGTAAPWLSTVIAWVLFLGAAAVLGFFALRAFSRQRLRVALGKDAALATAWDRESTDWAQLAEERAAQGDWREAVHGLYWAAIVFLEGRRAWRHNPSRTPREYVRLLKPGSPQHKALGGLTKIFERVWYGFGEAGTAEYGQARSMYEGLSAGAIVDRDPPPAARENA